MRITLRRMQQRLDTAAPGISSSRSEKDSGNCSPIAGNRRRLSVVMVGGSSFGRAPHTWHRSGSANVCGCPPESRSRSPGVSAISHPSSPRSASGTGVFLFRAPAWVLPPEARIPIARAVLVGYNSRGRGVAQFGSAPVWGAGGRRFESCLPDLFLYASALWPDASHLC